MWITATDVPRAVYNLAAFEVVLARKMTTGTDGPSSPPIVMAHVGVACKDAERPGG
jgi:hypothetical protein